MKVSTNKALSIGTCLCFGIMLPFAVTSCGAAKTYFSPLKIGSNSIADSPWGTALSSSWTDLSDQSVSPTPSTINDYIPSHYIVNTNKGAAFAWCQPDRIDDTGVVPSTYDWNLPLLNFTDPHNASKIVSYRNTNLSAAINSTVNTGRVLSSYYSVLLNYLTQPAVSFNKNSSLIDKWMSALLGGNFNFGSEKTNFYNFAFSNINTLAETGSPFQFASDKVDFSYASSMFGPGPLLSSNLNGSSFKDDSNNTTITGTSIPLIDLFMSNAKINAMLENPSYYGAGGHKVYIGQGTSNELVTNAVLTAPGPGQYPVGGVTPYSASTPGFSSPYVNYVEDPTSHKISNVYFSQVPVLIKSKSVDYTFYNFKKDSGFNPNHWILPTDSVNSAIKKSSSWKNYSKFTSVQPQLDSNICTVASSTKNTNMAWVPSTGTLSNPNGQVGQDYHVDPAFANIFNGNAIAQNDFIAFANYGCTVDTDSDTGDTHLYPYCAGISSAYPAMLFQDFNSSSSTFTLDKNLFNFTNDDTLTSGYGSLRQYNCKIDFRKLDTKLQTTFFRFFQKFANTNFDPTNLNDDDKYAVQFSRSLLANWDVNTPTTPTTFLDWN